MGWTVLYIAFGIVALWLLGEVLLQYKARLRWRLLAFTGFLGVVAGTALPSVVVIGLGIAAFAVGQTFVTLSVRSGFTAGWALGGGPGSSRRRRGGASPGPDTASLEVSDLRTHDPADTPAAGTVPVPDPVDDYGQQGYGHQEPAGWGGEDGDPGGQETGYGYPGHGTYGPYGPYGGYGGYEEETSVFAPASDQSPLHGDGGHGQYGGYEQYPGHQDHIPVGGAAGYEHHSGYQDQAGYQQYPDPYAGYGVQYGDGYGYPQQPYQPEVPETPPGGVWVPQQREGGAPLPPAEPQPYGYDPYADADAHDAASQQPQPYPQQAPQYPQDYYGSGPY